jgi:hypothetical protein
MRQASRYESLVAVFGLALVALTFAPWEQPLMISRPMTGGYEGTVTYLPNAVSGWDSHSLTAGIVGLFGLACLAQWVWLRTSESPAVGLAWSVSLVWIGAAVAIWLLVVVLGGADQWGAVAALATVVGIVVVGWLGFADERVDRAPAVDIPEQPIPLP